MAIPVTNYACYKVLALVKIVNEAVLNMVCLIKKKSTPLQLSTLTKIFSDAMLTASDFAFWSGSDILTTVSDGVYHNTPVNIKINYIRR